MEQISGRGEAFGAEFSNCGRGLGANASPVWEVILWAGFNDGIGDPIAVGVKHL